jgi:TonB-dependent starch-binding outer membrane protein SusC
MRMQITRKKPVKALLTASFLLVATFLYAQQGIIRGKVTDAQGEPLIGANVVIEGTQTGTVSNIDGEYSLSNAPVGNVTLIIKYVGFTDIKVTAAVAENQTTELNATLQEDAQRLDEVVVIGYGTQKKSDLTGAVASVKTEDLQKSASTNIASALQGRTAGLQISQNSGAPGSGAKVYIRGVPTITQSGGTNQGQAIWIVDGVGMDPSNVNQNDIESIEVLKDAASSAIYGSGGGAGVILVTTKKGKQGKTQASLNYYHGWQQAAKKYDLTNGPEFGEMYSEMQTVSYSNIPLVDPRGRKKYKFLNWDSLPSYDYQDMIFRTAMTDNIDFSVSGGNENTTVYFGVGYQNQEGILNGSSYQKFNVKLNTTFKVNKWFTVGENFLFNQNKRIGFDEWQYLNEYESPIMKALTVHPYLAPYDSTGNYIPRQNGGNSESPLPSIELLNKESNGYTANGTFFGKIEPLKGLSLESRINGALYFGDNLNFQPTYWYGGGVGQYNSMEKISRGNQKDMSYNWQNIISYNRTIANDFNVGIMAGFEVGMYKQEKMGAMRQKLFTEDPNMWYFDASTDDTTRSQIANLSGSGVKSTGYSYLGRFSFDYRGKYLFQFNWRRDASSKFGPDNRIGNFPGYSFGWKFTEEGFIKENLPFLSFGKLRYSYGKTGINSIRDYSYFPTVSSQTTFSYYFGSAMSTGAGPDVSPNTLVHWEEIVSQDLGIDLTLLQNRLSLTADWFKRTNVGMLLPQTPAGVGGWTVRDPYQENSNTDSRPIMNIGNILNKGWELSIGWKSNLGQLKYSVDLNYTYVKNVAEDLGEDSVRVAGTSKYIPGNINHTLTGGGIGDFWGYKVERLFQVEDAVLQPDGKYIIVNQPSTIDTITGEPIYAQPDAQPGDFKFVDVNGDGKIDESDMGVIGNPMPKHLLGLTLNLEYGWFDFMVFFEGKFGQKVFNAAKGYFYDQSGQYNWSPDYANSHYRADDLNVTDNEGNVLYTFPANRDAEYPRLDKSNANKNFTRSSDFYVEDGSYLRLKNIQLGVSLPSKWLNKISLSQVRMYIGAQNLLTFTKYSGLDPEVPMREMLDAGIDNSFYPICRMYTIGANIKF